MPSDPGKSRALRFVALAAAALLGILIAARAAAPFWLEPWLEDRLARALDVRVEIDDVDLDLLGRGVALDGGALYASRDDPDPFLAFQRLEVDVGIRELFDRQVRIRRLRLESPVVRLVRLASGEIDLVRELARDDASLEEQAEEETRWTFAIDRTAIPDGRIVFRDLALDDPQRFRARIQELEITRIAAEPRLYREPARFEIDAVVAGGALVVVGSGNAADEGLEVDAKIDLTGLPLEDAQAYLGPALGWSDLEGLLDAQLRYQQRPEQTWGTWSGTAVVRDFAAQVPEANPAGLRLRSLRVMADRIAPRDRQIALQSVEVDGATLLLRTTAPYVPALQPEGAPASEGEAAAARDDAAPDAPRAPAEGAAPGEGPAEARWSFALAELQVTDSTLLVHGGGEQRFGVSLSSRDLSNGAVFPLELELDDGDGDGSVRVEGSARLEPAGFRGRARWRALDVPRLLALLAPGRAPWLQSAIAEGDVALTLGGQIDTAADDGSPGHIVLRDVRAEASEPAPFRVAFAKLALDVHEVQAGKPGAAPLELVATRGELVEPDVLVTWTEQGFALPTAAEAGESAEQASAGPSAPEGAPRDAGSAPAIRAADLSITGGRFQLNDRRLEPAVETVIRRIEGAVPRLQLGSRQEIQLDLRGRAFEYGPVQLVATLAGPETEVHLEGDRIPLRPLDPYVRHYSSFSVDDGQATFELDLDSDPDQLDATIHLVLHDLALDDRSGGSLFRQRFGIPLSLGMTLLRDPGGDITLSVPIQRRESVTEVDVTSLVAAAIGRGLVNSLMTPLRLAGALGGAGKGALGLGVDAVQLAGSLIGLGGDDDALAPDAIRFSPGRAEPTESSRERLEDIADLLSDRPGLILEAAPRVVEDDVETLRGDAGDEGEVDRRDLVGLAEARAARVRALLGPAGDRMVVADLGDRLEVDDGKPRVSLRLRALPLEGRGDVSASPPPDPSASSDDGSGGAERERAAAPAPRPAADPSPVATTERSSP